MAVRRILTVLALTCSVQAQNPWVNRRKNKDKDAPVAADPAAGDTDFSKLNDMVKNLQQAGAAGAPGGEDMFAGMGDMWESLMDSPEMEEMLANPELLKATIKNNPLINAIPGASERVEDRRGGRDARAADRAVPANVTGRRYRSHPQRLGGEPPVGDVSAFGGEP